MPKKKPIVAYYAHSMRLYNSRTEKSVLRHLRRLYPKVINPNELGNFGSIQPYLSIIIHIADVVVCSEYQGYVGKGVFEEVQTAIRFKIPVHVVRGRYLRPVLGIKQHDALDWKIKFGKLITER